MTASKRAPDAPQPARREREHVPGSWRVVVVGGGFGGFFATRELPRLLKPSEAQVTLVSDTDAMLYQPLLPDVAVGALDPRRVAVPLRTALRQARIVRGRALSVDTGRRTVEVAIHTRTIGVPYDVLLLAPGAVTRMRDIPGLAEHAVGFKTAAEALYLRELILSQLEIADSEPDPARRRARTTFVVVGAGYAGTELAAQMGRLTDNLLPGFPALRPADVSWILLDAADAVMPELGSELGKPALHLLRRRGVDVRLNTSVSKVDSASVHLTDGTTIACATVIWCAGVTANPLVTRLGLPLNRGRLAVTPTLDIAGHPEIFAIGDAAAVPDLTTGAGQRLCPPTAQHAMRQAKRSARNIAARIHGQPLRPYQHHDLGLVVDLGGAGAVARPLGVPLRGWPAKLVARGYHLYALPSFRRRLGVLSAWAVAGKRPNDVSFGLLDLQRALAARGEGPAVPLPGPGQTPGTHAPVGTAAGRSATTETTTSQRD
jgi:NADH dehydrogenase